jgi:hypothetical protein
MLSVPKTAATMEKAHAVLELVALHCYDAATIVALSATSRQLKSVITMIVKQNYGQLLLAAVQDCAEVQQLQQPKPEVQQLKRKRMQALQWLLQTSGPSGLDTAAMQMLLCAKQMAIECVRAIKAAGGIPAWQQLAAAACNGHCVYQWLEVCRTQNIMQLPGMTALAEAVMLSTRFRVDRQYGVQKALDSATMQRMCEQQPSQADWLDVLFVVLQTPATSTFERGVLRLLGYVCSYYHWSSYDAIDGDVDAGIASPEQRGQWKQWRSQQLAASKQPA